MTKADLIELIAKRSDLPKKPAEIIVNTIFQSVTEALGERIRDFLTRKPKDLPPVPPV